MNTKYITCFIVALFSNIALAEELKNPNQLVDGNVFYYYEVHAEIPTPKKKIAELVSVDYRKAPDEFSAHELYSKIEPVIDKRINDAKTNKEVYIVIGKRLPDYDFEKKGFPTDIDSKVFIPYSNNYAAVFDDVEKLAFVQLDMEEAKKLSPLLAKSRNAAVTIYGTIVKSEERTINYDSLKTVTVKPTRLVIKLQSGKMIADVVIK